MLPPLLLAPAVTAYIHYDRVHYALLHLQHKIGYRAPLYSHLVLLAVCMIALLIASSRLLVRASLARLLLIEAIAGLSALCIASTGLAPARATTSLSSTRATPARSVVGVDASAPRWAVDMVEEEVQGPFESWANLKSAYGAVGDGIADDTGALQRALNDLGHEGKAQVLYLPAGTYRISATLHWTASQEKSGPGSFGWGGLGLVGADPATTTIRWAGPADQAMLIQNGGLAYRYQRLTWDGSGSAGFGVAHWWNVNSGVLYGGSFEHQDEVFMNMKIGIMAGRLGPDYGQLDSEGQIRRVTFINNSYAGLDTGSYNALDWWVWDSHFIDCARGVSNQYSFDEFGVTTGAGAMYVYRSLFERSSIADMAVANTGWFSLHNNVSIGSRRFFEAAPMGANAAVVIAQNNRVVQSTNAVPISLGNTGPMFLVDNQIQARRASYELTDWIRGRDVLSLGNRTSAPPPAPSASDRLLSIDDVSVPAASIATDVMRLPATPGWSSHRVFEVPAAASTAQIQALINLAARSPDPQPIIHFGQGTWTLDQPLQIAKHGAVQLVGDGYGSILSWSGADKAGPMLTIAAPARVTLRDMQWLAPDTTALKVSGADQPAGRIQIVATMLGPLAASHLRSTQLSLQVNPAIRSISLSDVTHAVAVSSGPLGPVNLTHDTDFLMADSWYEGDDTALFRMDSATFTYLGGHMAPATHPGATRLSDPAVLLQQFTGTASWIGMQLDLSAIPSGIGIQITGENARTRAYVMGTTANAPDYFRRAGGASGRGTVGFILNRTARGSGEVPAANHGAASTDDIAAGWSHARSLSWDSTPYQVPPGAVDIRLYHMKMDQTEGMVIDGQ